MYYCSLRCHQGPHHASDPALILLLSRLVQSLRVVLLRLLLVVTPASCGVVGGDFFVLWCLFLVLLEVPASTTHTTSHSSPPNNLPIYQPLYQSTTPISQPPYHPTSPSPSLPITQPYRTSTPVLIFQPHSLSCPINNPPSSPSPLVHYHSPFPMSQSPSSPSPQRRPVISPATSSPSPHIPQPLPTPPQPDLGDTLPQMGSRI